MKKSLRFSILIIAVLFSATGCAADNQRPETIREPVFTGEEVRYTTDVFRHLNFDGANPVATYKRSLSNESAINFQILVEAGGLVRGTPIPEFLESELSTKIQTALSSNNIGSIKTEFELPLSADAGTGLEHIFTFKETYLVGTIDLVYSDGVAQIQIEQLIKIELTNRTSTMIDPQEPSEISEVEMPEQVSTAISVTESQPTTEDTFINIQSNLIANGDFENINANGLPAGWSFDYVHKPGLSSDTGYEGLGMCSYQTLDSNDAKAWIGFGQDIRVTGNTEYSVSGWFYLENAVGFHVHVEWYDSAGNYLGWDQFTTTLGTAQRPESSDGWIYVQGNSISPVNASLLRLGIWHGVVNDMVNVEGSYICADNVQLGVSE